MSKSNIISVKFGEGSFHIYDKDLIFSTDGPAISTTYEEEQPGCMHKKTVINTNKFTGTIMIDSNNIEYRNCGKDQPKIKHVFVEGQPGWMDKKTIVNLDVCKD